MATLHSHWAGNDSMPRETFRSLEQPPTRFHSPSKGIARVSMLTKSLDRASNPFERDGWNAWTRVSNHFYARRSFRRSFLPRNTAQATAKVACTWQSRFSLQRKYTHALIIHNIIHNNIPNTRRRSSPLGGKGTCYGYGTRLLRSKRRSRFPRGRTTDSLGRSGTFCEFVKMKHVTRKKYYRSNMEWRDRKWYRDWRK